VKTPHLEQMRSFYDRRPQDLIHVVEDLIVALRGAFSDGVLAGRLDRLDVTAPFSTDPAAAKSRNRALQAVLLQYDQNAKKNGLHVLKATYEAGHVLHQTTTASPLHKAILSVAPQVQHKPKNKPGAKPGPCTWCATFLRKTYNHHFDDCLNRHKPEKLAQVQAARDKGQLQAASVNMLEATTGAKCIICNGPHTVNMCGYLNGVHEMVQAHQAQIAEEIEHRGRTSTSTGIGTSDGQ